MRNLVNNIFEKFSSNPGKMLIYTGVFGWFLSSAAQVVAIAVNSNIPKEQKSYLIGFFTGTSSGKVKAFVASVIKQIVKMSYTIMANGKLVCTGISITEDTSLRQEDFRFRLHIIAKSSFKPVCLIGIRLLFTIVLRDC